MAKILILGGYGNFGKRIAASLSAKGLCVIIAGRNHEKAQKLCDQLGENVDIAIFDVTKNLAENLEEILPHVVINTCGPFQNSNYTVAKTCIIKGVHYIDLADGRGFVNSISHLDQAAKAQKVCVISGASTVPGLSSAVVEYLRPEFSEIGFLKYGISPGQQAERELATTRGILSYVGKPLNAFSGIKRKIFGWQDIYRQSYPVLGKRWMANCDIPDLDLFPSHYAIKKIQFSAGLELGFLHLGLWAASLLVRARLPLNLVAFAKPLLKISNWFDRFGTAHGGMHVIISGTDHDKNPLIRKWFIIAKNGDGPHIPTIAAIILASRLADYENISAGARACVGMIKLQDYLEELSQLDVEVFEY